MTQPSARTRFEPSPATDSYVELSFPASGKAEWNRQADETERAAGIA